LAILTFVSYVAGSFKLSFRVETMTDVDYGYEQTDYGYDATTPTDYGYGDQTDYGYGPQTDYGYGEQTDYGYGEQTDYGYGDARPDEDGAPEEPKLEPVAPRRQQVKRRCSVTKFSLDAGAQEANKAQEDMRNMVDMLRQGVVPPMPVQEATFSAPQEQAPVEASDEKSFIALTAETTSCDSSFDGDELSKSHVYQDQEKKAKKGMMSRMRKRLSVFH
jgi:hypothetical protein